MKCIRFSNGPASSPAIWPTYLVLASPSDRIPALRLHQENSGYIQAVTKNANTGLTNNGITNPLPNSSNSIAESAIQPAPTSAPTKLCVVETGMPILVASNTVNPAPKATAAPYSAVAASWDLPAFSEKLLSESRLRRLL